MTEISVDRPSGFNVLANRWQAFAGWWLAELNALLPSRWHAWLGAAAAPRLLVKRNDDALVCSLSSSTGIKEIRLPVGPFSSMAIDAWLAEIGLKRNGVSIGLVIDPDRFFLRSLKIPKAAIGALSAILDQEVLRRTPFQLEDILHSATVTGNANASVLTMSHWIIRKDHAEAELTASGLKDVDFLACDDRDTGFPATVILRGSAHQDPVWARNTTKYLAVGAVALTIFSLGLIEWSQSRVAASVEASLAETRRGVQNGRSAEDPRMRLAEMKADIGFLQIWAELSRLLPDHTFLSEVRFADGKVTISGFSSDAAGLVRLIDGSPLFSGTVLTSGIIPDAAQLKDRFSISFTPRGSKSATPVARSPAGGAS